MRRIDRIDLELTIQAYMKAGLKEPQAVRESLKALGRNTGSKKQRPLDRDFPQTTEEDYPQTPIEEYRIDHINGLKIRFAMAKRYPQAYRRWKDNPTDRRALKVATLVATLIADDLDEPYRTAAKRIAAAKTVKRS